MLVLTFDCDLARVRVVEPAAPFPVAEDGNTVDERLIGHPPDLGRGPSARLEILHTFRPVGEINHQDLVLIADHPASARPKVVVPLVGCVFEDDERGEHADCDDGQLARRFEDAFPMGAGPAPYLLASRLVHIDID